jgi:hypothetical protein
MNRRATCWRPTARRGLLRGRACAITDRGWLKASFFVLGLLVTGVERGPALGKQPDDGWEKSRPVECVTLDEGGFGPFAVRGTWLVRSAEEWEALMPDIVRPGLEVPPPDVDWRHHAVIVATLDPRYLDRRRIQVRKAHRSGGELLVDVLVEEPEGRLDTQSVSAPFHLVQAEAPGIRRMVVRLERVTSGMPGRDRTHASGAGRDGGGPAGGTVRPESIGGVKVLYRGSIPSIREVGA